MQAIALFVLAALALSQAAPEKWSDVTPMDLDVSHLVDMQRWNNLQRGSRIVGGHEVIPHSRPYQVGLLLPVAAGTSFCGGSLITSRTVLTAAHCIDQLVGPVEVVLGAHNINQDEQNQQRVKSSNVVYHAEWNNRTMLNDIGLIILDQPVQTNDYIKLVSLSQDVNNNYVGRNATASGWGRASDSSNSISPVLREVTVPVIAQSTCRTMYLGTVVETHICTSGTGGLGTCNGDSGGPLVVPESTGPEQVGIVSFGIALGCERGWPPVYTRVTSYLDWIRARWQ